MARAWWAAVVVIAGCAPGVPVVFKPALTCEIQGSTWLLQPNAKPCDFYVGALSSALGEASARRVIGTSDLVAAVPGSTVYVHMEGFLCGGEPAVGCTLWSSDGSYTVHVGGNGGAILHELFHVADVRRGIAPEVSAKHPYWWNDWGWTAAGDSFDQTMADRDRASPR